jgi:hypothetical protein
MTSTVTIDQTTETTTEAPAKKAALTALATVGFIALLLIGITLAIYSARYIPLAISKITPNSPSNNPNSLAVVSSSSTIPFDDSSVLTATTTTTALMPPGYNMTAGVSNAPVTQQSAPVATTPAAPVHRAPYGLPDLSVTILATGYLSGPSTASFVPAHIIPPGARPAVEFSVADVGTNVTGPWNFVANIPSFNDTVFNSPVEPSLNPGDHTVFTLGFNEAIPGQAQPITVLADPNNYIHESNEGNNSASAAVTITQTGN